MRSSQRQKFVVGGRYECTVLIRQHEHKLDHEHDKHEFGVAEMFLPELPNPPSRVNR
jgi:hypothetical protein